MMPMTVMIILGVVGGVLWYRSPVVAPTVDKGQVSVGIPTSDDAPDKGGSGVPDDVTDASREDSELSFPPPLMDFPPPSVDLTGPKLGTQRVGPTREIGDIYQLYFHLPSFTLYMAVIEPGGMRSIWRLDQYGKAERVFAANMSPGEIRIFGDSKGVMYIQYNNPSRMVRTHDQFATWHEVLTDFGMFWQMADDGNKTVWGALHGYNRAVLYRSQDDGFSWEPWIDFQEVFPEFAVQYDEDDPRYRLRHLHGVIYNEKTGELIVGTGDVARYSFVSKDNGRTWEKLWDEGFTAWTAMSGGSRYLLGPDKLQGPGVVLYDAWEGTLKEVWNPGEYGYAGYTYSMVNVDGIYYIAFHTESNEVEDVLLKFGVIVSPDGEIWYPFLEWGPLGNQARTDIFLAPSPGAVYASVNGALYSFRPLDRTWFEDKEPFLGE